MNFDGALFTILEVTIRYTWETMDLLLSIYLNLYVIQYVSFGVVWFTVGGPFTSCSEKKKKGPILGLGVYNILTVYSTCIVLDKAGMDIARIFIRDRQNINYWQIVIYFLIKILNHQCTLS